jgi:hypothetical protein
MLLGLNPIVIIPLSQKHLIACSLGIIVLKIPSLLTPIDMLDQQYIT